MCLFVYFVGIRPSLADVLCFAYTDRSDVCTIVCGHCLVYLWEERDRQTKNESEDNSEDDAYSVPCVCVCHYCITVLLLVR
jgi:hypothetical protein